MLNALSDAEAAATAEGGQPPSVQYDEIERDGHELDIAAEGSSSSKRFKRRSRLRGGQERVESPPAGL